MSAQHSRFQGGASSTALPPDLVRLQRIEQHIIAAVAAAAEVASELANLGPNLDKIKVQLQCELFLAKIKSAQELVQQAVEKPTPEREFKAHAYHSMLKAHVAHEKILVVERLLQGIRDAAEPMLTPKGDGKSSDSIQLQPRGHQAGQEAQAMVAKGGQSVEPMQVDSVH
mmetsp:Transcript_4965/g.8645  ORF Transcript_4965/g.8645 Transcript_4965/m.8645 type:complete len:170 (+) Transcript_4965:167-676(+)